LISTDTTPGWRLQMRLVEPDTSGAGDALEHQRGFLDMFAGVAVNAAHEALLHVRMIEQTEFRDRLGHGFARTFGQGIAVPVVVRQPVGDNGLRHGGTSDATHCALLAADLDGEIHVLRNRQAAVVTGLLSGHQRSGPGTLALTSAPCGWHRRDGSLHH
jgi:hypothetical protein